MGRVCFHRSEMNSCQDTQQGLTRECERGVSPPMAIWSLIPYINNMAPSAEEDLKQTNRGAKTYKLLFMMLDLSSSLVDIYYCSINAGFNQ